VDELREAIKQVLLRKKVTLKKFQSLVGKMSFCSQAIRSSRAFLRRCYDVMANVKQPYHRLRISEAVRLDLTVWLTFLDSFNGVSYIPDDIWLDSSNLQLFTDSAGSPTMGCGCFFGTEWSFFRWPKAWHCDEIMKDITFLEMVPVMLALCLWGTQLQHKKVILRIDNEALVVVINKQTSKSKRLMQLVRQFVLVAMELGILFKAVHISTNLNSIADSISRMQWDRFRKLAPEASQEPVKIPDRFHSMMFNLKLKDC
jgi:hypothetical protein